MVVFIILSILLIGVCAIAWLQIKHTIIKNNDLWWKQNGSKNFPVVHKGKTVWVSRSVAVVGFVFCQDEEGDWYVLANKRGKGAPDYNGFWNLVCGYLDYNETAEEAVSREIREETGLSIPWDKFTLCRVNTSPDTNRQNVSLGYFTILDGTIKDHSDFSNQFMETNEVEEVKWVKLSTLYLYEWAFNHNVLIEAIFKTKIEPNA